MWYFSYLISWFVGMAYKGIFGVWLTKTDDDSWVKFWSATQKPLDADNLHVNTLHFIGSFDYILMLMRDLVCQWKIKLPRWLPSISGLASEVWIVGLLVFLVKDKRNRQTSLCSRLIDIPLNCSEIIKIQRVFEHFLNDFDKEKKSYCLKNNLVTIYCSN